MKKKLSVFAAAVLSAATAMTAFAGQWVQDTGRPALENGISNWWYQNDDGTYPANTWVWLDGNGDGAAESYRFDENGWLYAGTVVDNYSVDGNGAWVENGVVQTKRAEDGGTQPEESEKKTGWRKDSFGWKYYDSRGNARTGWRKIGGERYYFDEDGYMLTGYQNVDGSDFYFYENGALATSTVYSESEDIYYVVEKDEHYVIDVVEAEDWISYRMDMDRSEVDVSDIKNENGKETSDSQYGSTMDRETGAQYDMAMDCFDLINKEREKRGIDPLEYNSDLQDACDIRAEETAEQFSHTRPDGTSCFTILDEIGLDSYYTAGENIHGGSKIPEGAVEGWMNSKGHRENILDESFTEAAVGCYYDPDSQWKFYWVQLFYTP